MDRDGEIKQKSFMDVVQIILYQNLLWIMGLSIYGERRTQNPLSPPVTVVPLAQGPG